MYKTKKEIKIANRLIKHMNVYLSSWNIPNKFITKKILDIDPDDLKNTKPPYYIYIFINKSLKMKNGKIASQISHLARTMTMKLVNSEDEMSKKYSKWLSTGSNFIILEVDNFTIYEIAKKNDSCVIIDEGHTQVKPDSLTVLGFYPSLKKEEYDSSTKNSISDEYVKPKENIPSTIVFSTPDVPMYLLINKDSKITKYNLFSKIFVFIMNITKEIMQTNKEYLDNYMKWLNNGSKTIVLKSNIEDMKKFINLPFAHTNISKDEKSTISIVGFPPYTIDATFLSTLKLY
jgi:peptidyl-tRNA hydrolase